jgi:hypothetical protein
MQLLAHQLAPIYNTSIKCYSYASRRGNVHECHNCTCIIVVLPSRGSKSEIHLPKGCPCLCRRLEGQEPGFLSIGLHLFAGNLMQVLMIHFFRALLHSIGVARRGPDSWGWARGCMPPRRARQHAACSRKGHTLSAHTCSILATLSKLCIHFLRSESCPTTSTMCIDNWPMEKRVSVIAVVFARAWRTSSLDGT